jgi:hypothetical protein
LRFDCFDNARASKTGYADGHTHSRADAVTHTDTQA